MRTTNGRCGGHPVYQNFVGASKGSHGNADREISQGARKWCLSEAFYEAGVKNVQKPGQSSDFGGGNREGCVHTKLTTGPQSSGPEEGKSQSRSAAGCLSKGDAKSNKGTCPTLKKGWKGDSVSILAKGFSSSRKARSKGQRWGGEKRTGSGGFYSAETRTLPCAENQKTCRDRED